MVLPAYAACIEEIRTIAVEYPALKIAQQEIEKKLQKYYDSAMSKNIYYIATILDPRFKLLHFKGRRDCAAIKQKFLRESKMFAKYCEILQGHETASACAHHFRHDDLPK